MKTGCFDRDAGRTGATDEKGYHSRLLHLVHLLRRPELIIVDRSGEADNAVRLSYSSERRRSRQAFDPCLYHTRPEGCCTEMSAAPRTLKKDFLLFSQISGYCFVVENNNDFFV